MQGQSTQLPTNPQGSGTSALSFVTPVVASFESGCNGTTRLTGRNAIRRGSSCFRSAVRVSVLSSDAPSRPLYWAT